jgi:hypothetical protein
MEKNHAQSIHTFTNVFSDTEAVYYLPEKEDRQRFSDSPQQLYESAALLLCRLRYGKGISTRQESTKAH